MLGATWSTRARSSKSPTFCRWENAKEKDKDLICQELYSKRQQWIRTILQEGRKLLFEGLCTLVSPPLLPGSSGGRGNRWGLFWASFDTCNAMFKVARDVGVGKGRWSVSSFIRIFPFLKLYLDTLIFSSDPPALSLWTWSSWVMLSSFYRWNISQPMWTLIRYCKTV